MLLLAVLACKHPDTGKPADSGVPTNAAPGAPEIVISPDAPTAGVDFSVRIVTPAVDPDGDPVTYRYDWTVDGVDAVGHDAFISGASTAAGQRWEVAVTANDSELDSVPAVAAVVIANAPPVAPGLTFEPRLPQEGDALTLVQDPAAADPDGDPLTLTTTWYENDVHLPELDDLDTVDGSRVQTGDTFRAVVSVSDGVNDPVTAEVSATVSDFSCAEPPAWNLGDTTLSEARAYHGLAFDDDGHLLGHDGIGSIIKSAYDGTREIFVPGMAAIQQMDRFPNGDWVYADNSRGGVLERLEPSGARTVITTNAGGIYGVRVGPDGKVWMAYPNVSRVDPETGDVELLLRAPTGRQYRSLEFNLDSTVLYIGVTGENNLYALDLDENLDPVGEPRVFASGVGGGYHDGVGIDTCGALYVADYWGLTLLRVSPDGATSTPLLDADFTIYGHGLQWGNGIGGWRSDTIYQPQPNNGFTVREVVVGFENGDTVRTWNGVKVPW